MSSFDPPLPPLVTRADARAAGLTDRQVSHRVRRSRWQPVRRGTFLVPPRGGLSEHDVALLAALRSTSRDVAVGHAHAARLWGLPCPLPGWGRPVLLARGGPHRDRNGVRIVVTPLPDEDVVRHPDGWLVTSPARTVTDCLRVLAAPDAIAVADAAARHLLPAREVVAAVAGLRGWPGVRQARRVAALADGRRESALESWSALAFDDLDVPQPLWQVDITDAAGFVGRGDGWWACGLVGESDGRSKYLLVARERGGADAERLAEVLHEERLREARIRRAGLTVVRWGANDVLSGSKADALAAYLRRELRARQGLSFTATITPHPFLQPLRHQFRTRIGPPRR
jgi:hypothetical protein